MKYSNSGDSVDWIPPEWQDCRGPSLSIGHPSAILLHILLKELFVLFWEYLTDMSYVLFSLIGGIVAIAYVYIRKSRKKRVR